MLLGQQLQQVQLFGGAQVGRDLRPVAVLAFALVRVFLGAIDGQKAAKGQC